jgi:hypothetical protein
MYSPGEIAARDGVSKQAVSKTLSKLLRDHDDIPVERDARNRVIKVSLAHYDHHRGFFGNAAQAQAPRGADDDGPEQPRQRESRDEALRQQAWLNLQREKLRHAEEQGSLVRADKLADALAQAGRTIQSEVNRLQNRADDIALAVSKEGTSGARMELRKIAQEINTRIADTLAVIAEASPETDEVIAGADE